MLSLIPYVGINAVLYYAPQIFGALGLSSNTTSLLATGVVGIVMLIATIPAILYIDRIGRKPVLALGALGMGLCHFIIAVIFARNENKWTNQQGSAWACIVMVWLFVFHFGWSCRYSLFSSIECHADVSNRGSLCLDHCRGSLATVRPSVRYCPRCVIELDEQLVSSRCFFTHQ